LENEYLVKEFIDGNTASEIIANDLISEAIIQQLFEIYRQVKQNRLNIDYFPANFIINEQQLFYIDYECNPYTSEWNLPSWGLYYWANCEGFKNFLSTDDSTYINESIENGIPIKKPFENKVSAWLQKFDVGWSKFIEN
jgi:TP53 regulating kinase and related kinases